MSWLHHERIQRGDEALRALAERTVTVCGAGALGSHLVEGLARSGVGGLRVIDFDRIEERNLSTQPWQRSDIGALKVRTLAHSLYRAIGLELDARSERLDTELAPKLLEGSDLVIDAFDNSESRRAVKEACETAELPCLHAGLAADYGEVIWNERYRVPAPTGEDDCDYPLARNLVSLTAAVACEVALRQLISGERQSYTITLEDLSVNALA